MSGADFIIGKRSTYKLLWVTFLKVWSSRLSTVISAILPLLTACVVGLLCSGLHFPSCIQLCFWKVLTFSFVWSSASERRRRHRGPNLVSKVDCAHFCCCFIKFEVEFNEKSSSFNMYFHSVTEKTRIHCRLPCTRLG